MAVTVAGVNKTKRSLFPFPSRTVADRSSRSTEARSKAQSSETLIPESRNNVITKFANGFSLVAAASFNRSISRCVRVFGKLLPFCGRVTQSGIRCPTQFNRWLTEANLALIVEGASSEMDWTHKSNRPLFGSTQRENSFTEIFCNASQDGGNSPGITVIKNCLLAVR